MPAHGSVMAVVGERGGVFVVIISRTWPNSVIAPRCALPKPNKCVLWPPALSSFQWWWCVRGEDSEAQNQEVIGFPAGHDAPS
jgi:hypothetical protein